MTLTDKEKKGVDLLVLRMKEMCRKYSESDNADCRYVALFMDFFANEIVRIVHGKYDDAVPEEEDEE